MEMVGIVEHIVRHIPEPVVPRHPEAQEPYLEALPEHLELEETAIMHLMEEQVVVAITVVVVVIMVAVVVEAATPALVPQEHYTVRAINQEMARS